MTAPTTITTKFLRIETSRWLGWRYNCRIVTGIRVGCKKEGCKENLLEFCLLPSLLSLLIAVALVLDGRDWRQRLAGYPGGPPPNQGRHPPLQDRHHGHQ